MTGPKTVAEQLDAARIAVAQLASVHDGRGHSNDPAERRELIQCEAYPGAEFFAALERTRDEEDDK